jgi:hypothetical protein
VDTEVAEPGQKSKLSSFQELHKSQEPGDLITSHDANVAFHEPAMAERERYHDFVKGNPWTPEEEEVMQQKGKAKVSFQELKPSQRTFIGTLIQQRYDIKPAPMDESDQAASDAISVLYHWIHHSSQVRMKDPQLINEAWIGGSAWQESVVEVAPGKRPVIRVYNMNPFCVYPDPSSRDLIERKDCRFIDRVTWLSLSELCDFFPEHAEGLRAALADQGSKSTFDAIKKHADRAHEWQNFRNGKFKVVERLYKVSKAFHFGTLDGERVDIGWDPDPETLKGFQEDYPDHSLQRQREEFFHLAIVCTAWSEKYLYNGEYHCQPRDPVTEELIWPWVELIDEDLDGDPSGHVAAQVDPIRVLNSLLVNKLHQAKNASGQVHVISADHFEDDEIEDVAQNVSDGSRSVVKKKGAPPGSGVELAPLAQTGRDNNELIDFAANASERYSSTPPAMKGQNEGAVAGVLNEQRIQQGHTQNAWSANNFIHFLTKRAKLWVYYVQEYYTWEEKVRVLQKENPDDPDFITINKVVMDPMQGLRKLNDISAVRYDIVFEDSWQSPSMRAKILAQITEFRKMGGTQMDPGLDAALMMYFFRLSDAPQDLKDYARKRSMTLQQETARASQVQADNAELDQAAKIQELADREAAATVTPQAPAAPDAAGVLHELQRAAQAA